MSTEVFDSLPKEQQAAINAKIIEGFATDQSQLDRYNKEMRDLKNAGVSEEGRKEAFAKLLAEDRERLAHDAKEHPENYKFNPSEGLSKSRPVLIQIQESMARNPDYNGRDNTLQDMNGMINNLRRGYHYGEEKISLDVKMPEGVCMGPSVDMSEDITPPPTTPGSKEPSCAHKR